MILDQTAILKIMSKAIQKFGTDKVFRWVHKPNKALKDQTSHQVMLEERYTKVFKLVPKEKT